MATEISIESNVTVYRDPQWTQNGIGIRALTLLLHVLGVLHVFLGNVVNQPVLGNL